MADGSASAALNPTQPAQGAPDPLAVLRATTQKVRGLEAQETEATDKYETTSADIDRDTSAADAVYDRKMAGVQVPTLSPDVGKPFTPPAPTDPKQVWASAAMVFAGLGSLLTRQPMTTAMNAAAGAMQAFQKGDQAAANAALQQWKSAQDTALKIADFEEKSTHDLVEQMRDLRDAHDKESEVKKRDLTVEYKARMASFQNLVAAQFKSADEVVHYADAMAINNQKLAVSSTKVMQANTIGQGIAAYKASHPNASPDDILTETGRLMNLTGHQWTDQETDQHVEEFKKRAAGSMAGKNYDAAMANVPMILDYDVNRPPDAKTVILQAAALDKSVQNLNGNRAMRGFQLQLMRQDMGLLNHLHVLANQVQGGGPVTKEMIEAMQDVARVSSHIATLQYGDYITSGQYEKWKVHLDPTLFTPDDWHPDQDPLAEPHPSPLADDDETAKHREFLKSHNTRENWLNFDDVYGQGSAALVMEPDQTEGAPAAADDQ